MEPDRTEADAREPERPPPADERTRVQETTLNLAVPPALQPASTAPARVTAAEALDHSDLRRMRVFHRFGVGAPFGAIALSLPLGGDPLARYLFWAGAALLGLCNVGLVWLSARPARWQPRSVGPLWIIGTFGVPPALYYFGPFSGVIVVEIIGIVFIAIGRSRATARAVAGICIGGQIALAVPMMLGWIEDVGLVSSAHLTTAQFAFSEVMLVAFLLSGYGLGRWARSMNATALGELHQAMRVIGDQQQALAEVVDEHARQNRQNEGRWTGHVMGSFKLGLVLGRGAMGEVYEGVAADGRAAAVKLLNQRATDSVLHVERFYREMTVAAALESPHIVRVYELSRPDAPVPYIAMERLHGTDLAARLRTESRIPSDELVVLLDQVARALEVAHRAGIVHRDLKPHNLFCHDGATWKVLDFGVSKLLGGEGTLTGEGIVGTPQYMAPEQATGGEISHLADVYALGAIAYRCLTGRAPFAGKDLSELVYQVVHAAPIRPSLLGRMSPAIDDALAVAMAKDPRRRFPTAQAFARAFVDARRGRALGIEPPPSAWT